MKVKKEINDFNNDLKIQIQFLNKSSITYDNGFKEESIRISTIIRTLLHNTKNCTSLLKHLNKDNILFYDSSLEYDPNNLVTFHGLISLKHFPMKGWDYTPKLGDLYDKPKIELNRWWNKIVICDKNKTKFTRKDLILNIANKDGGAHIDSSYSQEYFDLIKNNSLNWGIEKIDGEKVPLKTLPHFPSIRQMAHEVIYSLKDEFPEYFER